MNRRDAIRMVRRDLRRNGCTCHPRIDLLPAEHVAAVGARNGAHIEHENGCPVGERCKEWNARGILPVIVGGGCGR